MTSVVRFAKETGPGPVLDDQATRAMGQAFEAACKDLDEAGQSSVVYEAVAKRIIEKFAGGDSGDTTCGCHHRHHCFHRGW